MSYPTSPYLLYDNQFSQGRDAFNKDALMKRFGKYETVRFPCANDQVPASAMAPQYVVSPPCCPDMAGQDVLGIGVNTGILDYQFGSQMSPAFCGSVVGPCGTQSTTDCEKCPCQTQTCSTLGKLNAECDYGYARNRCSAFGPTGGNRNGNLKWGG
uniref:Uncharacterized protein n=1 Tax=viral metagenome TaxID=1070528 RepID=A0A6C0BMQ8_9ZZZZ